MWRPGSSRDFLPVYLRTNSCGLIASSSLGTVITLRWRVEGFESCWRLYLRCPPESFQFRTGRYGKPSLAEDIPVRFNLTHSYGLALYAFAINRDLGIDVEKNRAEFASKEIAERYFSAAEQRELSQLPTEMHTDAFFLCWTRKEAYVKAHGDGLQIPLDSFDVSLTPGKPEILRSADQQRWSMRSFSPASQYVGSIVGEGKFDSINFWNYPCEPAIESAYE